MMAAPVVVSNAPPASASASPNSPSAAAKRAAIASKVAAAVAAQQGHAKATLVGAAVAQPIVEPDPVVESEPVSADVLPATTHVRGVERAPAAPGVIDVEATPADVVARPEPRYLPGDPMAPQPSAARTTTGRSARLRLNQDEAQQDAPKNERQWLYWAVCAVVLVSVLVLAIGLF